MTNGQTLRAHADRLGLPFRTLEQVTVALASAEKYGTVKKLAALMLRHGRLTDEARTYVEGKV